MSTVLRLLILEDDPYDAELEIATLEEAGFTCQWERVETQAEFLASLDTPDYDLILADYSLPAFDGLTALKLSLERDLDMPFILVSGVLGEEIAIESLKAGATDYVLKDRLSRLRPVVRRALREREEQRERKRAEEALRQRNRELALLNRVNQALTSTLDLEQVLGIVLEEVRRLLEAVACSVWLTDQVTGELACQQASGPKSEIVRGWRLAPEEGIAGWVVGNGESLIVPDALSDERYFKGVDRQTGLALRSILGVPLRVKEDVIGVLEVVDLEADRFKPADLALVESLAVPAAAAIENARLYDAAQQELAERKRAEEALRESEETARVLLNTPTDIATLVDTRGFILDANEVMAQRFGRHIDELIGMYGWDLLPPGLTERRKAYFDQVIQSGEPVRFEDERQGTWFDNVMCPVFDAQGKITKVATLARDITERKQTEEALRESKERYRAVVEYQTDLICRFLPDGTLTFVNEACCRYFGKKREELVGHSLIPLILEEDRERTARYLASFSQKKPVATTERRVVAAGGKVRWQQWIDRPIFDEQGHLIEFQSVGRDITERKQAEEERERLLAQIQEQAQRIQQIIDTVPEGVLLLDADERVVLANPVAQGHLSALADAKVGDTLTHLGDRLLVELLTSPPKGLWHEVAIDDPVARTFEVVARPVSEGASASPEATETGPTTGGACPEPALSAAEGPAEGPAEGWVLVIRDVTQEREIERRARQQERLAAVGQLAAGIAHDFNNIMATIVLYAQMASRAKGLSTRDRERMATINQQAHHASRLIRQILDFSRRTVLERQPLDLAPLLKEQVKILERTLLENIEVTLVYGPDEHTVNADPTRIQQVMMNLALNARDAMPKGGNLRIGLERIEALPPQSPPLAGGKPRLRGGGGRNGCGWRCRTPGQGFHPTLCRTSSNHSSPPKRLEKGAGWDCPRCMALWGRTKGTLT